MLLPIINGHCKIATWWTLGRFLLASFVILAMLSGAEAASSPRTSSRNAYVTMMYMGTPRDHEFYIAARVMLRSLARLNVNADLVMIASKDVPQRWVRTLKDDGVKVVSVEDIPNPYSSQPNFDQRFRLTLNKLYAWKLVEYDRVVMLDADNLFLQKTDELFQCGQFCAAFINPCIFHTGLFVLQPSVATFKHMMDGLKTRENRDGADQGYLMAYFDNLLEKPLFTPPLNGTRLNGQYRLPLGYQMDASYYYLRLRWNVPCGPNSVITFPSLPWLKPWYWWSWPVLPLGLAWHQQRQATIGYATELPLLLLEALFYFATGIIATFVRRGLSQSEKSQSGKICSGRGICPEPAFYYPFATKVLASLAIMGSLILPAIIIPRTVHPLMGWSLLLLGSSSLLVVITIVFHLPMLPVMTPWFGIFGALLTMAFPFYSNGIVRALSIAAYAFFASPFLWWAMKEMSSTVDQYYERESVRLWTNLRSEPQQSELMKIC